MHLLIRDVEQLKSIEIDSNEVLFCDTETASQYGYCGKVEKNQLKDTGGLYGEVRLFQMYQEAWDVAVLVDCLYVPLQAVLDLVQPFECVFHNASYDLHTINCHTDEMWMPSKVHDTMYLSRLEYFGKTKFDFYSCLKYTGNEYPNLKEMNKAENQKADWGGLLTSTMRLYAECDVTYMAPLWNAVKGHINDDVYELDIANLYYAVDYDRRGLPVNTKTINKLQQKFMTKMEEAYKGLPVNPNSPPQVQKWLDVTSSDKATLGELALKGDDRAQQVLDARAAGKVLNFLKKYNHPVIRGFHNPCGAITGRMSCAGGDRLWYENTQQPPRTIFPAIEAPDGKVIVYKDYAGLELRMAVAFTGDPTLAQILIEGQDPHTNTVCQVYNCTPEEETTPRRIVAKFCNFGIIYGIWIKALMALIRGRGRIAVTWDEVAHMRKVWLDTYHYFKAWHEMTERHLKVYGFLDITTAMGRTVRCYNLNDALNFPIQGSSAEVTKLAVHMLNTRYDENPEIINVVHDSIALCKDEDKAEVWKERLNDCMVDAWYEVISNLANTEIPMPREAEIKKIWGTE